MEELVSNITYAVVYIPAFFVVGYIVYYFKTKESREDGKRLIQEQKMYQTKLLENISKKVESLDNRISNLEKCEKHSILLTLESEIDRYSKNGKITPEEHGRLTEALDSAELVHANGEREPLRKKLNNIEIF